MFARCVCWRRIAGRSDGEKPIPIQSNLQSPQRPWWSRTDHKRDRMAEIVTAGDTTLICRLLMHFGHVIGSNTDRSLSRLLASLSISRARSDSGCWITRRFLTRLRGTSKRDVCRRGRTAHSDAHRAVRVSAAWWPARTWGRCCAVFLRVLFAQRTAGASRHPAFPVPSWIWGWSNQAKLGRNAPRGCEAASAIQMQAGRANLLPLAPSLRAQRSNPVCRRGAILDCFAALAMTLGRECAPHSTPVPRTQRSALAARPRHAGRCLRTPTHPGCASLARRS